MPWGTSSSPWPERLQPVDGRKVPDGFREGHPFPFNQIPVALWASKLDLGPPCLGGRVGRGGVGAVGEDLLGRYV